MVKSKGRSGSPDRGLIDKLTGERAETLKEIGVAWLKGTKIDWQEVYAKYLKDSNQERFRIPLPTYPFERERYWIDVNLREFSTPDSGVQMERMNNRVEMEAEETSAGLYQRPPLSTEYAPPQDKVEQALANVWKKFFGIREVGIYDDFFELGGDSLRAITVVTEIHKRMDIRVPITEIFQSPTIKKLAEYINRAGTHEYSDIEPVEQREYYPLSSVQQRLYTLQQMDINNTGYNDTLIFQVEGQLDKDRLENVFNKLVARHESLRTSFELIGEETVQRVHPVIDFIVDYYDLSGEENPDVSIKEKQIIQEFVRSFDLSRAPLLRVGLIHTPPFGHPRRGPHNSQEGIPGDKHILMVDMHHVITDGSSIGILVREFMTLYTGGALSPLHIQYKDYTQWQNSDKQKETLEKQEFYWLKVFEDEVPVLNLPTDYLRPAVQSFEGNTKRFVIDPEETEALKKVALKQDITLFMILFSVFNVMLAKICGQEDIVVGTPIAARTHADLQHLIGMLVNTLALRNFPSSEKTFKEFLREVRENTLVAFENQDYLFEDLVEQVTAKARLNRDTGRNPIFDVMFNLLNLQSQYEANLEVKFPGLSLKPYHHEKGASIFDMLFQGSEGQNGLYFDVEYCTRLFKPETIERFIGYFKRIISRVCEDVEIFLSDIEILSPGEKEQLLVDFNRTEMAYPREKTIYQLFEEQAARGPEKIAIVGSWQLAVGKKERTEKPIQLTYRELNRKSDQLSQALIERGIGPDVIVGIMVEDSLEMIIGILGILKAGGAFLPIDPDYPQERIDYMLKDSNVKILLSEMSKLDGEIIHTPAAPRPPLSRGDYCKLKESPLGRGAPKGRGGSSLAYIIYTSGSTGRPKGVLIPHGNITNQLYGLTRIYSFAPLLRHMLTAPFTFDPSVQEVFLPLITGGTLFTVPKSSLTNPAELLECIAANHIDLLDAVPTLIEMLVENIGDYKGLHLEYLILAGEIFSGRLHRKIKENLSAEVIINIYGPTEATINTTFYQCQPEENGTSVPIGSPLPNYKVFIVDKDMSTQPVGVSGEILIGGEGVASGYLNNPELTVEKFISISSKSYRTYISKKIYKTGDLARWLADGSGNIEFLGRIDQQVKIRGHRVELGEIESGLMALSGIKEAVVTVRSGEEGETYLCAYVVPKKDSDVNVSLLRQELSSRLPGYMIPSYFVEIEQIPLTSSNKVNRRALPEPETSRPQLESAFLESATGMEKLIAETWQDALKLDKIGVNDNFFDLGGNSISLVKVIVKLRRILNIKIPTVMMLRYPTVHLLAQHIMEEEHLEEPDKGTGELKGEEKEYMAIEPVEMKDYYLMSSAQKRLYILQQMDLENTVYNMPEVLKLEGGVDKDKLEQIFREIIWQHESFRTSFITVNEEPVQLVHGEVEFEIEYYDLAAKTVARHPKDEDMIKKFIRPFDLSKVPLLRVRLTRLEEKEHLMMLDMHHIISDGVSNRIFVGEFLRLYFGETLLELRIQYKDYAVWQNSKRLRSITGSQEEYWLREFSDEVPVVHLPTDYLRPAIQSFEGSTYTFDIGEEMTAALNRLILDQGVTLFMVLIAGFNILLFKFSGQEDIVMGTLTAGRGHSDLENIIGMFVNTLALRNYPKANKTFNEFLHEVKARILEAFENQDYQFEDLVEKVVVRRDASRSPLFDVMFVLQDFQDLEELSDTSPRVADRFVSDYDYEKWVSRFDMTWMAMEKGTWLSVDVEYCTRLFNRETIERFAACFKKVLAFAITSLDTRIADIEIISDEEKQRILFEFNDTEVEYPIDETIHQLFEEQAERTPDGVAVTAQSAGARHIMPFNGIHHLTYKELNQRSSQLSHLLKERGVQPDDIVGIMLERSIEMIIAILGILKADGAYLPIDPEYPEERINYMLKDSRARVLLSEGIEVVNPTDLSAGFPTHLTHLT
ncbi:MAG: amino acid adenylation domain-containing protein, partial [Candidatus Aminicenantes bacterium]|nr:amino acid adenylation domain-containing protein [Candidatus Aminicenantes bacterium]NIM79707.1 amino acid adenylation domain-containing protein [Candidatus Aminicenantes bacterium]NIN19037.1 amino acid adenylation domain-containing protein [Candidatus Aminicenantes bacterium]NIN42939.1 amino acid adenylation domain-containing protein [Candidatus Aminicenantes bacterium]NIN85676.1 amino acid adenylation domain-containing protein [Candidatus Aminicenantes bacterium]